MSSRKCFLVHALPGFFALTIVTLVSPTQPASAQIQFASRRCPVLLRVLNAANPNAPISVDLLVNGRTVATSVPFRGASSYVPVRSGSLNVKIVDSSTGALVGKRMFSASPNSAYSIGVTGAFPGPAGQQLYSSSPFVIQEDLSPPNPTKFRGKFYRFSETGAVIDFRATVAIAGQLPENLPDAMRITDLIPKTAIAYPELTVGTYNFNPVLPGSSDTLVNDAFSPPERVEITNVVVPAGAIYSVIAAGNALGTGPNSLLLSSTVVQTAPPDANGCTVIQQS
jgi:hypothetical protein